MSDIQYRLKKRFIDRLSTKLVKMRKDFVLKNWRELRSECRQIQVGGESFEIPDLAKLAALAQTALPEDDSSPAISAPEAKQAVESLIAAVDQLVSTEGASKSL